MQLNARVGLRPGPRPGAFDLGKLKHGDNSIQAEIVVITSEIAAAWLDQNTNNRKLRPTVVDAYASDMRKNRWRLTFDAIRFDVENVILDGQHRLKACVKSGVAFTSLVIYNLPVEMRDVIDTGARRSGRDILTFKGYHNVSHLAAVCKIIYCLRHGMPIPTAGGLKGKEGFSTQDMLDVSSRHPTIARSISACMGTISPSLTMLAFIHWAATHNIGISDVADRFIQVFKTGVPSMPDCPAHRLREFVVKSRGTRMALAPAERWRASCHVWNVFAAGKPMPVLRWPKEVEMAGLDIKKL